MTTCKSCGSGGKLSIYHLCGDCDTLADAFTLCARYEEELLEDTGLPHEEARTEAYRRVYDKSILVGKYLLNEQKKGSGHDK